MCQYFLKISSTFEQYRDNTDNRDNFGHYNRDKKFSYRYIPMGDSIRTVPLSFKATVKLIQVVGQSLVVSRVGGFRFSSL